ncbi:MAG: DNA-binding domain-containing protein [Gammaproteobacteria bacterium]
MSELSKLQHQFQQYLLSSDPAFKACINSTEKVSADTRMQIYKNAYRLRLIEALSASYPVLNTYLGEDQFTVLADDYINQYPSVHRSIRWYGDQLADYLVEQSPYRELPFLAELAKFEWIMTLVFDEADSPALSIEAVATVAACDWPHMQFIPQASVRRLNLIWNVVQIWQAINDDETPPEPMAYDAPVPWLLWRVNFTNQFCSVPADEAYAMDAVLQGATFSEIGEGLCTWVSEEEAGLHAASLLKGWIQSGILSNITIRKE